MFTFLISIVAAGFFWWRWIAVLARAAPGTSGVPILLSSLAAVFFILLAILLSLASHDVRDSALYIIFYIAMGYAVIGLGLSAPKLVGLQAWDIAQRNNNPLHPTTSPRPIKCAHSWSPPRRPRKSPNPAPHRPPAPPAPVRTPPVIPTQRALF